MLAVVAALVPLSTVPADSPPWCPPEAVEPDPVRVFRALSLDLRGTIPTIEEYEALGDDGNIPDAMIDAWLESEEFVQRVVHRHGELLWPNVENVSLTSGRGTLGTSFGSAALWSPQAATTYRGDRVPCLDEPASFDAQGRPIATEQDDGTFREGWVEVVPYWAPDAPVRVCAYEAQDQEVAPSGRVCSTGTVLTDLGCGCGPDLNFCRRGTSELPIRASFGTDLDLRVADVIRRDASYLELFQGQTAYVNGPQVHFWEHQSSLDGPMEMALTPFPRELLPDLDYTDVDTWVDLPLSDAHAGILTAPGYLLRFQTQRGRANRFYNAFLCQPFQPPSGGLPAESGEAPPLDLQVRDGCKYCHALLEPAAAHWGRWTPGGAGYLDPETFPAVREDCVACAEAGNCSGECREHYLFSALVPEQVPFLGMLQAYEFRRPEHEGHVERGPRALLGQAVADGRFTNCTARTTAAWLLGRDPVPEEEAWIADLEREFVAGGFSYRALVRAIITSPVYGRVQ